jgi:hypothetical protein
MPVLIEGTYPVRKHLARLGGKQVHDAEGKFLGWSVPTEKLSQAEKLIVDAAAAAASEARRAALTARAMRANTDVVVMPPVPVAGPGSAAAARAAVLGVPSPVVTVTVAPDVLDPWALLEEAADLLRRVLSLAGDRPLGVEAARWLRLYGQTQAQRLDDHVDAAAARATPWEPVAQDAPQAAQDAPGEAPARQVTLRAAPAAAAPQEAPRTPQAARQVTVRPAPAQTPAKPATAGAGALAWALGK